MENPKRKNSEKPKYNSTPVEPALPDGARGIAIIVTCLILCIPKFRAGLLIVFDYGFQCQSYTSSNAMLSIYALMLLCIALFLWWMPQFIAEQLLNPTHLKITLITIITTAIFIAILTAFGVWLPCLPI